MQIVPAIANLRGAVQEAATLQEPAPPVRERSLWRSVTTFPKSPLRSGNDRTEERIEEAGAEDAEEGGSGSGPLENAAAEALPESVQDAFERMRQARVKPKPERCPQEPDGSPTAARTEISSLQR